MKFERMKLPVLTGMDAIERYNPKSTIYLSSVRTGIPCLIMNGKICDISGRPFKNEAFQDDFKEFSERVTNCKTVVHGRIIDTSIPFKNYGMYELGDLQRITYNSSVFARHKDNIKIEVEDIYCFAAPSLSLKDRHMFLTNIILSIKASYRKTNVEIQPYIVLSEYKKEDADIFILAAAKRNETVLFRSVDYVYTEGAVPLNEARSFYLNPFEEFEGKVEGISFEAKKPVEIDIEKNHITSITIACDDLNKVKVDYTKEKLATRRALYDLTINKKLTSIKFEAILHNKELKFQRPL